MKHSSGPLVLALALSLTAAASAQQTPATSSSAPKAVSTGVREAAWSPDSKRLAASWFDVIWTMTPDGKDTKKLVTKPENWTAQRDPAWSPDGKSIAFSASSEGQFDVWIAPAAGGAARRLTATPDDERWPSWTRDGRVVFSQRASGKPWQLHAVGAAGDAAPVKISVDDVNEYQGTISPDGKLVAFVSDREPEGTNDADIWVRELVAAGATGTPRSVRVTRAAGVELHPAWAPDNARIAFSASRAGQSGIFVAAVPSFTGEAAGGGRGAAGPGRGAGGFPGAGRGGAGATPNDFAQLASRQLGVPAWSPDGETLVVATTPQDNQGYNGNPQRNDDDAPIPFAAANDYALWRLLAPRAVDQGAKSLDMPAPDAARWTAAFDQVWQTMKSLYYRTGDSAAAWDALKTKYRPKMAGVQDLAGAEAVIDQMLLEQPLMKPAVESTRAVIASGSPLASRAGAQAIEKGGNIIDAAIATAFALGVVEPDASGLGGDGQAILFLKGMSEPIVVEYKDMTPGRAFLDNPKLFTPTGQRTAPDGPTVANIPGIPAGLELLYRKYASKKVAWADLLAPAITLAEEGFILDEALPTTIAEGRAQFAKYPEAAKIFLPNGRVPRAGDRFINKDYAETLKLLAKEGGRSFYEGTVARRIAADMEANGGVITFEDLAQYRAVERKPLMGRYHGHLVYSVPPPAPTGAQIVETLNILDNYKPKPGATIATDADYLHYVIDAWRVRDGGQRIADPDRYTPDLGNHLEAPHALERFKLIDPKKVYSATAGGRGGLPPAPAGLDTAMSWDADAQTRRVQTGTTSFVVADAEGNMIAFTQTLSTWGGNYYVSKGLGFLYNDHFRGGAGRGGGFGAMVPYLRSSSTSVPTLVFAPTQVDPGRFGIQGYAPRLAVGCAGNAWIPASVYNVILGVVDGGLSAQRAIEAPRILIGGGGPNGGSRVQIEDRIPRTILADLEARGHTFQKVGRKGEVKYGYVAAAVINTAKGTVEGGAEPRRSHATAAAGK